MLGNGLDLKFQIPNRFIQYMECDHGLSVEIRREKFSLKVLINPQELHAFLFPLVNASFCVCLKSVRCAFLTSVPRQHKDSPLLSIARLTCKLFTVHWRTFARGAKLVKLDPPRNFAIFAVVASFDRQFSSATYSTNICYKCPHFTLTAVSLVL